MKVVNIHHSLVSNIVELQRIANKVFGVNCEIIKMGKIYILPKVGEKTHTMYQVNWI